MSSFIEYLLEQHFDIVTETEPMRKLKESLSEELNNSQKERMNKLLFLKDMCIANTAKNNYRSGFLDGVELLTTIYNRHWNGNDG